MTDLSVQNQILKDAKAGTGPFAECKPELRQYAHPGFGTNPSLLVVTEAPSSAQFAMDKLRDEYIQPDTYPEYWEYWKRNKDALLSLGLYHDFLRHLFTDFDYSGLDVFDYCLETSVVKWPSNRTSNKERYKRHARACFPYLLEEVDVYQPEAIIAVGTGAKNWVPRVVSKSHIDVPVLEINLWSWWRKYTDLTEEDWKTEHIAPVVDDLKLSGFGTEWGPQT